jgi:hypothetical protein
LLFMSVIATTALLFLFCGWRSRSMRTTQRGTPLPGTPSLPPAEAKRTRQ